MTHPVIMTNTQKINLTDKYNKYEYILDKNFNIAFGLTGGKQLTPDIGSFEGIYTIQKPDADSEVPKKKKEVTKLKLVQCD